jgi:hypothetical protein
MLGALRRGRRVERDGVNVGAAFRRQGETEPHPAGRVDNPHGKLLQPVEADLPEAGLAAIVVVQQEADDDSALGGPTGRHGGDAVKDGRAIVVVLVPFVVHRTRRLWLGHRRLARGGLRWEGAFERQLVDPSGGNIKVDTPRFLARSVDECIDVTSEFRVRGIRA